MPADKFVCIDDDLFLNTYQIEYLLKKIDEFPSMPHGFWGQNYTMKNSKVSFEYGIINENRQVDILNRAYFFNKMHLTEIMRIINNINIAPDEIGPCDDIILSFSGNERPMSHNIGIYEDCPTSNQYGVAQWRDEDFDNKRSIVLREALKVKNTKN